MRINCKILLFPTLMDCGYVSRIKQDDSGNGIWRCLFDLVQQRRVEIMTYCSQLNATPTRAICQTCFCLFSHFEENQFAHQTRNMESKEVWPYGQKSRCMDKLAFDWNLVQETCLLALFTCSCYIRQQSVWESGQLSHQRVSGFLHAKAAIQNENFESVVWASFSLSYTCL